ncbi:MAG: hypothetical protein NTW96_24375 [Planctomycetia bacterium]|nr:hypothetical protein [Planctomycetia bacterium]
MLVFDPYRWFVDFEPVGSAGYSIYIYHITLDDANRMRRELGLPELTEENAETGDKVDGEVESRGGSALGRET